MIAQTANVVPKGLIDLIYNSDQSTKGQPVLPDDKIEEALGWLRRIVLDFDALDAHIGVLQELYDSSFRYPRMRRDQLPELQPAAAEAIRFTYHSPLEEGRVLAILEGGPNVLRPGETNRHELPKLLLNPVALHDLFDVINDLLPEKWLPEMQRIGRELYQREVTPAGASPRKPKSAKHWVTLAGVAATVILPLLGAVGVIIWQRNETQRLISELDETRNERDHLRQGLNPQGFPLRLTADSENRPVGWSTLLKEHYDPDDSAEVNLRRLESLGGAKVKAEVARLRQTKPEASSVEILDALLHWTGPKK